MAKNRGVCQFLWCVENSGAEFPAGVDARLVDGWASDRVAEAPGYMHSRLSSARLLCPIGSATAWTGARSCRSSLCGIPRRVRTTTCTSA